MMILPAQAEITFEASWKLPSYEQVRAQMLTWLDGANLNQEDDFQAHSLWPAGNLRASDGSALLDRAVETFALVEPRAKALLDACNAPHKDPLPPQADWLEDTTLPDVLRFNLRLYYARWLAQHNLYDEVLQTLDDLKTDEVVDPAGLLFYRMVAYHQVVDPDRSRLVLAQLLEQEEQLSRRYLQVAQLLRRDLAGLKDESLDHVARRMNDVRRRLDIGRAGKQVQVVEKSVVDSLDRIIKKLEQQQQQQSGQSGGAQQSSKPMQDSQLPSMRAPMKVEQRNIGNQSGWGDLPAKEREQALQQIGREFPAHYRQLIEQYFRELADESSTNPSR
ncbi:MAG: hypothetical protein GXP24_07375 [Planctomycetes bacterium]|nr:hypothetical protein [Planctomycetota bacterium]